MFKKGFKALKSIGKKSSKKKEKGDGDNVSEAASENLAASQGSLVKGASASSDAPVVLSEIGDGESAGDHGARPRSVGIPQPSPSAAGAARPVLTKQTTPVGQTRGTEEEDSVVAALQALRDQKVSQSQTSKVLVEESDEDDDEEESSSTESELTFKKKLKAEQDKEARRKKGLSVSSSSSEQSSWGDTSDILPSPESKQPLTKPQILTQEQPKTAAQTVKRDGDESSASNWSDSETEGDDSQLRPSTVVKAPVSPDVVSAAGSVWSDEGGGTITGVLLTSAAISQPPKPSADADNQPEPVKSNPALSATEKDDVGSLKASAPPVGGSDISTSKSKEHTDFLPSDSTWSDSDDDQVSAAKPPADIAESQPITRTISPKKSASDWSDDDLPSPAPVKPATEPEMAPAARPTLERQQSAESAWSDDDSIELAAAPAHSTALESTFTKTEPELGDTYNKGAELRSTYTKPPELDSTFTKPPELSSTFTKPSELDSTFTKPPELSSTFTKPPELSSTYTKPSELSSTYTKPSELDSTFTKPSDLGSTFTTAVDADVSEPVIQPTAVSQVQTASASQRAADEMDANVANSDFQLKESLQEIQKLNTDKQEMSEKLVACDLREAALTRTKEELERELAVLTDNRNKLKNTVEALDTKVQDLQVQNSKLAEAEGGMVKKAMYDDVTQKLKVIMDENQRLVADHQEAESKSSVEISRLRKVIEEKDVIIQHHGKAEDEWQREKMELAEAVEHWEGKYTQLDGSSRHQQQVNQQLESQINKMREKLRVLESPKIELEIFKETSLEMEMLKGEMTDKGGYEMLQVEMEKSTREYSDRLAKRDTKIEEMTRAHEQDLRKVKDKHQQELDELKRNIQRGEARQETLNSEMNLLQSQNKELQAKNSRLRTEQSEKNKGLISMREYEELQRDHDLLQKKVVDLQQAAAGHRTEQAPSERNFQFSASSSDDDEDARHRMYNGNSSIVLNNAQQKELERQEDKIKQLRREISDLKQVINDLQAEQRSVSSQLQDKRDEADDLKVQKEKLLEKLKIRDQEVTMELSKKLEGELEADAERSKLRQDTVLLEGNVSRLTEANEQLKRRLASVSAELEVKREGGGVSANMGVSDAELVQLRTELAQLRSNGDAERATFMAAIEEKDREVAVETAEKESAKAALDEVTKSLMYLQDEMNTNYIPLANHREALARTSDQDERAGKELSALREKLDTYSKEALEAKNVCSMQQILINEKDRELRDKEKESRNLRRELDGKVEALSNANAQLQQASRERDRDHDRLREEMLSMSYRHGSPTHAESLNYKTMYDELRIDKEREKATLDQLIERLKWENSTLEERLQTAKVELQDKVKLETNFLLTQGEADRYKQETAELMRKSTKLEERVEHLQREADHLKDSRIEAGSTNQTLREENSRLREDNVLLRSQLESLQKDLSGYSVSKEEMEAAMATAKLTTDVNDMTRQESQNEVQLERKHKMVLYKQAKSLRTEINEKNIRLQELEKMADKLKAKVIKLKAENNALQARLREQTVAGSKAAWDAETGLTQADMLQQEVRQLQSQLTATVNDAQSQARKAKARKYDLDHQQSRADHLQKLNEHLSRKLDESSLMVQAAERTASDLRSHISDLNNRLQRHEQHESSEMSMNELWESQKKENMELEKEVRQLKKRLSVAETGRLPDSNRSRSRSVSPVSPHRRSRTTGSYTGQPMTAYEKDRRALTRAAWAVLDDHGLGPPAEQRVFENLDRIWRRNASRPARYL